MSQGADEATVGYAIKRAQAKLHTVMDAALADLGVGVSQYACLVLLADHPGISNAELARGVFVSRQATHQLLAGLRASGLIEIAGEGRGQRISLSRRGARVLRDAADRVARIEDAMLDGLSPTDRTDLLRRLLDCADALDRVVE